MIMNTRRRSRIKKKPDDTQASKPPSRLSRLAQKQKAPTKKKAGSAPASPPNVQQTKDISSIPLTHPSHRPPQELILARRLVMLDKYVSGKTPDIISFEMQLDQGMVERELDAALDLIIQDNIRHDPHHQWAKYAVFQLRIIRKLQEIADTAKNAGAKAAQAAVSALKEQSNIMDKILDKGLTFGVVNKPDTKQGKLTDLLGMDKAEIKALLTQEIKTSMVLLDNVDPEQIPVRARRTKQQGSDIVLEQAPDTSWMMKPEHRPDKQEEKARIPDPIGKEDELADSLAREQETFIVPPTKYQQKT